MRSLNALLLVVAFVAAVLSVVIEARRPREGRAHRGAHCGCPAYANHGCDAPCSDCCAPGPCPMTGPGAVCRADAAAVETR